MKILKKLFLSFLVLSLIHTVYTPVFAVDNSSITNEAKAIVLQQLNLLSGLDGQDLGGLQQQFGLTREQGVELALRLAGMNDEHAKAALLNPLALSELNTFADARAVSNSAEGWVALAVSEGVMNGDGTNLNPGGSLLGRDLATFIMNALGYANVNNYSTSTLLLANLSNGGLSTTDASQLNNGALTLDQASAIIYGALTATPAGANSTIIVSLVTADPDLVTIAKQAGLDISSGPVAPPSPPKPSQSESPASEPTPSEPTPSEPTPSEPTPSESPAPPLPL